MDSKQINSPRLYLQIADKLADNIKTDGLNSGARLPSERELAASFDVSRQTVREALIALEVAGTVEIKLGSGVYVKAPSARSMQEVLEDAPSPTEILEARKIFESEAAALAAQHITDSELAQLRNLLEQMQKHESDGDTMATEEADKQFHLLIAKATRNSAIFNTIKWLWDLRGKSKISQVFHNKVRSTGSHPIISVHQKIYYALENRDSKVAQAAMVMHLSQVLEEFSNYSMEI